MKTILTKLLKVIFFGKINKVKKEPITTDFHISEIKISVYFGEYTFEIKPTKEAFDFAKELVGQINNFKQKASEELLDIYNNNWREEDEKVLTKKEFEENLIEPSILIFEEKGVADLYFSDSGMFCHHTIQVSIENGKYVNTNYIG